MRIAYSIENLRRLESTPLVEIRPITILLGRNSAGKSTFLRSLPLHRQSIEIKTSAPVLWYGDYVDFGNFRSAVTDKDIEKSIKFSFEFKDFSWRLNRQSVTHSQFQPLSIRSYLRNISADQVLVSYSVRNVEGKTKVEKIEIKLPSFDSEMCLKFGLSGNFVDSISLGEIEFSELLNKYRIFISDNSLFSPLYFFSNEKSEDGPRFSEQSSIQIFKSLVEGILRNIVDGRTSNNRISSEAIRILRNKKLDFKALSILKNAETITFRNLYNDLIAEKRPKTLEQLNAICQAQSLVGFLQASGECLTEFFSSVEYIGPARARSERFYRQQELEVSEISPDGKNLPVFLASLNSRQLKNFSNWVDRVFGYGVSVKKTEGHISINLEHRGQSVNIVDTGYGVSQVLPVLAQIWWMQSSHGRNRFRFGKSSSNIKTLAIEQPELHLHPAHQALLADVFVEAQSLSEETNNPSQYYVVETHSEALINRLGELIEAGKIAAKNVQVIIFGDASDLVERSNVTIAEFDESGILCNWPHGFFNFE